jgi:hypothetical protein
MTSFYQHEQHMVWEYKVLIDGEAPVPDGWTKIHSFIELGTDRPATLWGRPKRS